MKKLRKEAKRLDRKLHISENGKKIGHEVEKAGQKIVHEVDNALHKVEKGVIRPIAHQIPGHNLMKNIENAAGSAAHASTAIAETAQAAKNTLETVETSAIILTAVGATAILLNSLGVFGSSDKKNSKCQKERIKVYNKYDDSAYTDSIIHESDIEESKAVFNDYYIKLKNIYQNLALLGQSLNNDLINDELQKSKNLLAELEDIFLAISEDDLMDYQEIDSIVDKLLGTINSFKFINDLLPIFGEDKYGVVMIEEIQNSLRDIKSRLSTDVIQNQDSDTDDTSEALNNLRF